jgi:hypothetical protein
MEGCGLRVGCLLHTDPQERAKTTVASSDCRPRPTAQIPGPARCAALFVVLEFVESNATAADSADCN